MAKSKSSSSSEGSKSTKKSKKSIIFIAIILILLAGIGAIFAYANYSPTRIAYLHINEGSVEVDMGSGFVAATQDMDLKQNYAVKTLANSRATIILYESIITELDENTVVKISDLSSKNPQVNQDKGTTWNKFESVSGVETYKVQTPTSVATIRGTDVEISNDKITVADGNVLVKSNQGEEFDVLSGEVIEKSNDVKFSKRKMSKEEKKQAIVKMKRALERMKEIRNNKLSSERKKFPFIEKMLMNKYGGDEKKLQNFIDDLDNGKQEVDTTMAKLPAKTNGIKKIEKMTKEIKKQNKLIKDLETQDENIK